MSRVKGELIEMSVGSDQRVCMFDPNGRKWEDSQLRDRDAVEHIIPRRRLCSDECVSVRV